ncbi:MAG TPA: PD-(D/E)XK nuclease family protein [Acetivibrio sp.]|jgi:CRISPR/Cas system-associated exonuclease Cas4 (RecB family)|nr:PD-(D/E)XK nuclease family protein [Clostridium sp.]HOQ36736.1 PD-(D/E)XK nuclease family protein [Acetivibrio sp.]HPT91688.1 PD-(D/E)XK nuclease family protein [Acetivibrio sp.]HQA57668.1 PD-(D/E)XK nuclease family protein [Acetivibrio sp.]
MLNDLRYKDYFLFTQFSMKTFEKCPLKFKKRYLEGLNWEISLPYDVKKSFEMGQNFHLLAYRYFLGIDAGLVEGTEGYDELKRWLDDLQSCFKKDDGALYYPEYKLRMAKGNMRLEANFDLLVIKDDSVEIWDWKTHRRNYAEKERNERLEGEKLKNSLQTKVYLFVLKEQLGRVVPKDLDCSKIKMYYWQPDPPKVLAEINYSTDMHETFGKDLQNEINMILGYDYNSFDKEMYKKNCRLCEFNWFCNNERMDYKAIEEDEDFLDELDWDSIEELT